MEKNLIFKSGGTHFLNWWYEASLLSSFQEDPTSEHRKKYLRKYSETYFNEDFVFCSMVMGPRSCFSKSPDFGISNFLEAYMYGGLHVRNLYKKIFSTMFRTGFLSGRTRERGRKIIILKNILVKITK